MHGSWLPFAVLVQEEISKFAFFPSSLKNRDKIGDFLNIYFIVILQKKYGLPQILQKYIHLQSWPTASGTLRRGPRR
jgi:hypothetical protein